MSQYHFIYKTINLITKQIYVGQRRNCSKLDDGYIGCGICTQNDASLDIYFHNAVRKYGYENFKREILEFCEKDQLNEKEIFWIKELKSHYTFGNYNMTWSGGGGDNITGHPNYEEICRKHKVWKKGRIPWNKGLTKETSEIIRSDAEHRTGQKRTLETCNNIRQSLLGRVYSKESCEARSKTLKSKPILICPWCNKQGGFNGMRAYHFDNCKLNPNYIKK